MTNLSLYFRWYSLLSGVLQNESECSHDGTCQL